MPIIDGEPKWPWDDEVARDRLAVVARRLGLRPTGDESRLDGASNDTWLLGEQVLRVCWRGDLDRLAREAALLVALPEEIPAPQPLECGRDDDLSWLLMPRLPGIPLADVPERRGLVRELGAIVRALHAWQPPYDIRAMVEAAAPRDGDDALTITGKRLVPLARAQQLSLAEYVRAMPFVPGELVDAIVERLSGSLPEEPAVFLHGDLTPGNVLVHEGRISGLLDWEWAWFGPAGTESTLPLWWARCSGDDDYVAALTEECPELFGNARQRWVYLTAFALRCVVHWPPDRPEEELYPDHPLLLLRDLAS